jgi:hypothetical protein
MRRVGCSHAFVVIHAEGSDIPHEIEGKPCPCLPRVECARCNRVIAQSGEERGRLPQTVEAPVHVYPAWQ